MPKKPSKNIPGNFAKRKTQPDGKKALEKFLSSLEAKQDKPKRAVHVPTSATEAPVVEVATVREPAAEPRQNAAPAFDNTPKAPKKPKKPKAPKPPYQPPAAEPASVEPEEEIVAEELPLFSELGLSEPVARAISAMGFESPTPIQARAIPVMLSGRDLIGQAQTGTGKTAAFALPIIERIDTSLYETQALIMAPTRELAVQVAGGIHDLAKFSNLRVVPVYGGQPIDRQFRALKNGAHVVVGTPGRIQDHIRRGSLVLDKVKICVLDEADEMLAMGFIEDIEAILSELPEERQMAFFSATMPSRILALTKRFLRDPERISIVSKQRTLETTNQAYYEVAPGKKLDALARVLDMETPGPTIVFCRTRQETQDLAEALRVRGYNADPIHGDMNQPERERVLKRFREGLSDLLIATDVAARGLDIDSVTHVINFDVPFDAEQYIHRIGRTGRAGRTGDALTLVEGKERRQLKFLEKMIGSTIRRMHLPTVADIAARRRDIFKETLRTTLEEGTFDGHLAVVEELSDEFDPSEIAAAALHMLWQEQHSSAAELAEEIAAEGEYPGAGMTRIFIGLGRQDGLRPGDIVGAITHEASLPGRAIGAIDILDRSAFVEVPADEADHIIDVLRRIQLRGRKPKVAHARPREER